MLEGFLERFLLLLSGAIIGWFARRIWVEAITSDDDNVSEVNKNG